MSTLQHTPGPWYTGSGACHQIFTRSHDGTGCQHHLATAYDTENSRANFRNTERQIDSQEAFANARLIASAPDMLEALQWALVQVEATRLEANPHCKYIRDIIAKATLP